MMNLNDQMDRAVLDYPTVFTRWDGKPFKRGVGVSASRLWACARQIGFARAKTEVDPDYTENIGLFERGHAVEDRIVYRLAQALPKPWRLLFAGAEQKTLVWGNVSATPDGLLTQTSQKGGRQPPFLDRKTLVLPDGTEIFDDCLVEIKSVDPRGNRDVAKDWHITQARLQMALFRKLDIAKPVGTILLYVDAADYAKRTFHWVPYEKGFLEVAEARAKMIIGTEDPMDLDAEGIWDGGCQYCPFKQTCGEAVLRYLPLNEVELNSHDADHMALLIKKRQDMVNTLKKSTTRKIKFEEDIRKLLRKAGTNRARLGTVSVSYLKRAAPRILDVKKLKAELGEEALEKFYKTGQPSARLNIKERN